jgi:hypothetical protein
VFTPVLAKHSKSFSVIDCISVGVDLMQRSFEPMRKQVEAWQRSGLTGVNAKVAIYESFVEMPNESQQGRIGDIERANVRYGTGFCLGAMPCFLL